MFTPPTTIVAEPEMILQEMTYTVKVIFGASVMVDTTGDGLGNAVGATVETAPGQKLTQVGAAVDTTGDGMADAVGIDTTGDGLADTFVDLTLGGDAGEFKATVRLAGPTELQVSIPDRAVATISNVADAIETFCDNLVEQQGLQTGLPIQDCDFEVNEILIGAVGGVKLQLPMDTTGDGMADTVKDYWQMPAGFENFGEVLRASGDVLTVKGESKWIVGGVVPEEPEVVVTCCSVM